MNNKNNRSIAKTQSVWGEIELQCEKSNGQQKLWRQEMQQRNIHTFSRAHIRKTAIEIIYFELEDLYSDTIQQKWNGEYSRKKK